MERHGVQTAPTIFASVDLETRFDVDAGSARYGGAPLAPDIAALVGMDRPDPPMLQKFRQRLTGVAAPGGAVGNDDAARIGLPHGPRDPVDQRLRGGGRFASHVAIESMFGHDRITRFQNNIANTMGAGFVGRG